ncbi:NAD(P)H-quinone oxidoreductase [Dyella kyungheensis]|uniref:NAD(P)H-quinone oxidoreductase n=1 Tax=Dyella kyungheensis TaxID=1242174 RepID=A0ABS2JTJ8_9GAMM|nr:NAD(P)H-quinone oxidoreductase [Dyella kyungheensis]MBM7121388.1 NAD(P)H-quinone oxidoreductase [Dyella kyungheensis]
MRPSLPATMLEIQITAPGPADVLKPRHVALPTPNAGEVLIHVRAAGVNRPDVLQREGHYPIPPGANPTPGLEVAGTVAAIGEGVTTHAVGDDVCALTNGGGYAQYCVVPEGQVLQIPRGVSMAQAAAIPETFFTVWANLFLMGRARRGEVALIHGGTSGIGTTALMLCRELGVRAFATAGGTEKCEAIRELGAEPINYRQESFVEVVLARTEGRGADVILDIMGAAYFADNLATLARDGRLLLIGFLGGAVAERVNLQTIMAKRATVTGSAMRPRSTQEKAAIAASLREHVWPVLAQGRCLPMIHATYPLARAADAHREMESSQHIGKIVLEV